MAYGDKRLRRGKLPSDYTFGDFSGLGVAGAVGILSASLLDLLQRGEGSALFLFNKWVVQTAQLLGLGPMPLFTVVLILMTFGALSIFYFQPVTFQGAFAQGFGLLAGLMTIAPSDLGTPITGQANASLPYTPAISATSQPAGALLPTSNIATIIPYAAGGSFVVSQASSGKQTPQNIYDVTLSINLENGLKNRMSQMLRRGTLRGRLYIPETKLSYDLFRNSQGTVRYSDNTLHVRGIVPGQSAEANCFVRLEIDGYKIEIFENEFEANQQQSWEITMTPSNTPLFIQRLNNSYWF